ncbi:aminopeptidase P family protein [Kushneria marisflavi]|uniref:Xaa-Pro aminopeptidase n=1 Tax=Kushneria marisflavi TaxID=157779 RepID=A0A240UMJ7_9GAMM|nr:aminopeptidase P family protein [Kushneria marisflavi]ART62714.1 Xaa-Pro aminopeptidase [Kushneria marisflavi]RKD83886.1 Xaa-Pro aminopeptidase [Kushneria marisflavi]
MTALVDTPSQRIDALRRTMMASGINAWLVPSSDPHLSEYLPGHWQGREWLTGFTGSVGTLLVTHDFAGLWVDSRYWVQADKELSGSGIEMMKVAQGQQILAPIDWLNIHHPGSITLGLDGAVLPLAAHRAFKARLGDSATIKSDRDLLEEIWPDRPALPQAPVTSHDDTLAGQTRSERLAQLRQAMDEAGADAHLISTLDDIAWLFNLRGSDVDYNPVFLAHALVDAHHVRLFIDQDKVPAELREALADDGVFLHAYAEVLDALTRLPEGARLLIDPARVTLSLIQALPDQVSLVEAFQPTTLAKACKSEVEIDHVRAAMARDGAALCRFLCWLDETLVSETPITELTIDARLTAERTREKHFISRSFPTIAGFNANGALPHYRATESAHSSIEGQGLLLIDSGAQYLDGTTDITRVIPVGEPTAAQKADYTRVLKGMMALSRTRFPEGIEAPRLDAIARAPLWEAGLDYGHGTGHGVGYFLNVHEGPQVISRGAQPTPQTAMREGMITSIEPGLYRPNQWGIRIENLVANRLVTDVETLDGDAFLEFETLTLCPIDTRLIEPSLLREDEINWLDNYHRTVFERLAPKLDEPTRDWLAEKTQPLAG